MSVFVSKWMSREEKRRQHRHFNHPVANLISKVFGKITKYTVQNIFERNVWDGVNLLITCFNFYKTVSQILRTVSAVPPVKI